jgi:hypothetical protein
MTFKPKQTFCVNNSLCFYENKEYEVYEIENNANWLTKEYEVYEIENNGMWLTTENPNQLRFFGNKELYEKFKKIK